MSLPIPVLAERLRVARFGAGITRDAASAALGLASAALVAIEEGRRAVAPDEVLALASLYGMSVGRLTSPDAVHVDLAARFRRAGGESPSGADAQSLALLDRLVTGAVQLERMVGQEQRADYPPPIRITASRAVQQAEDAADALRARLGLGLGPIPDLVGTLEMELGLRIFSRPLPSQVSGLYACDPAVGACMLINASHPRERRVQTAAHQVGRFVADRQNAHVLSSQDVPVTVEERFAERFGAALTMPAAGVRARFERIAGPDGRFAARELVLLAHQFEVATEAMCRRLEDLRLVPDGTWESIRDRGFSSGHERQVLGEAVAQPRPPLVSPRLAYLAATALDRELLSEGQVCDLLAIDRLDLKDALAPFEIDETGDGGETLPLHA